MAKTASLVTSRKRWSYPFRVIFTSAPSQDGTIIQTVRRESDGYLLEETRIWPVVIFSDKGKVNG